MILGKEVLLLLLPALGLFVLGFMCPFNILNKARLIKVKTFEVETSLVEIFFYLPALFLLVLWMLALIYIQVLS